jgi:hypothetical protein
MKTRTRKQLFERAYALMVVMTFLGLSLLVLTAIMTWTSQSVRNTDRANEYYASASAAEAATEKVLVHLAHDYIRYGETMVTSNLTTYQQLMPSSSDNPYWANYSFTNPVGDVPGTWVANSNASSVTSNSIALTGEFAGLYAFQSTYYISSDASLNGSRNGIKARVGQWIGLQSIPIFQFAIFYNMDMEIEPGQTMVVTGPVHGNSNIFLYPNNVTLTFSNAVTASGTVLTNQMPGDTHGLTLGNIAYAAGLPQDPVPSMNLPIGGLPNTPDGVFQLLQMPPSGQPDTLGNNRFYNEANLIVVVSNNTSVNVAAVSTNGSMTSVSSNQWTNFLTVYTNTTFYNGRDGTNVQVVQLDITNLMNWAATTNNPGGSNNTPSIVYIADLRTNNVNFQTGVRLVHGAKLPSGGFTVATPNPVYIQGDYNVKDATGSSLSVNSTTHTYPAAVLGDAINILSDSWQDSANATLSLGNNHGASDTTVNAAFLTGIVPTSSATGYSGGVENFPRFLENWSGINFWYNGSMVAMFNSRTGTGSWNAGGYYTPPTRHWAFDVNFRDESKVPPGSPRIPFIQRLQWAFRSPNTP